MPSGDEAGIHPGAELYAAWADADGLNFPLLSDFWPHGAVTRSFEVFDEVEFGPVERADLRRKLPDQRIQILLRGGLGCDPDFCRCIAGSWRMRPK